MSQFGNVNVVLKANVYFGGNVTSRTINFENGEVKTLGIILPGEYRFDTGKKEIVEIQSGKAEILLPGEKEWRPIGEGERFEVPANSSFGIRTETVVDYICSFIDE
jgi:uncharacterized protein YaiE (UPF0345 family)